MLDDFIQYYKLAQPGWDGQVLSPVGLHLGCSFCTFTPFSESASTVSLRVRGWVWVYYYMSGCLRFHILSVSKVESTEQRVVLRGWLASLILIQEDRWASHFHAQLLDSLLVVNGQQEGLEAGLGAHCGQDGEVLRKNTFCMAKRGGVDKTDELVRVTVTEDTSNMTY